MQLLFESAPRIRNISIIDPNLWSWHPARELSSFLGRVGPSPRNSWCGRLTNTVTCLTCGKLSLFFLFLFFPPFCLVKCKTTATGGADWTGNNCAERRPCHCLRLFPLISYSPTKTMHDIYCQIFRADFTEPKFQSKLILLSVSDNIIWYLGLLIIILLSIFPSHLTHCLYSQRIFWVISKNRINFAFPSGLADFYWIKPHRWPYF